MTLKVSKWTDSTINKLRDLYLNKELSASEIAKELGFTKNAIIGKIHRLNLNEEKLSSTKKSPKEKQQIKGKYTLEQIDYGMCVWPSEEIVKGNDVRFLFCGDEVVQGRSYCKEHLALVYLANKKTAIDKHNIYKEEAEEEAEVEVEVEEDDIEDISVAV